MTVKEKIIEETIRLFLIHGIKLKSSDVAANLGISKKTIYKFFESKEQLLMESVDSLFSQIKQKQDEILNDSSLDDLERLRRVITAMPGEYSFVPVDFLVALNKKYPKVFDRMNSHLEAGWEETFDLMDRCQKEGLIREIDQSIFKMMVVGSIEKFINSQEPELEKRNYSDVQKAMIDILIGGIKNA